MPIDNPAFFYSGERDYFILIKSVLTVAFLTYLAWIIY